MGFLKKDNISTINLKLTSIGRKKLSEGNLTYGKIVLGDSEINYELLNSLSIDPSEVKILRPKDFNPKIYSIITKDDENLETSEQITGDSITNTVLTKTVNEIGFFTGNQINNTFDHLVQSDILIHLSGVTGTSKITLKKSPTFLGNIVEPVVGDYMLIKWTNPLITTNEFDNIIDLNLPYVWYKIEQIVSGTLLNSDLIVVLDKPTPNYNTYFGNKTAIGFCYPNSNSRFVSGDSTQTYYSSPYISDFVNQEVFTFETNCIIPQKNVKIWNMSIIFSENIVGTQQYNKSVKDYYTITYSGLINYLQEFNVSNKSLGIVHYSNVSPTNNYGESFYNDSLEISLPTIMWHNVDNETIGLMLKSSGIEKLLPNLNTRYFDLIDNFNNVVGKVFNDLKIISIEDQELLFAMSFKSNRNWTLPTPTIGFNLFIGDCDTALSCDLIINVIKTDPTIFGANNGTITINASSNLGTVLYSINGGTTFSTNNIFTSLFAGTYNILVIDTGSNDCFVETSTTLNQGVVPTTTSTTTTTLPPTTMAPPTTEEPTTTLPTTTQATTTLPPFVPTVTIKLTADPFYTFPIIWKADFYNGLTSKGINVASPPSVKTTTNVIDYFNSTINVGVYKTSNSGVAQDAGYVNVYLNGVSILPGGIPITFGLGDNVGISNALNFIVNGVNPYDTIEVIVGEG